MIIKRGDTHEVAFRANADLTGATIRLLARGGTTPDAIELPAEITDATTGTVAHKLTGDLEVGDYAVELEVTRDGEITTFPNDTYSPLKVIADLG